MAQGEGGGESMLRQAKGAMVKKVRSKIDGAAHAAHAAIDARKGDVDVEEAMRMLTSAPPPRGVASKPFDQQIGLT